MALSLLTPPVHRLLKVTGRDVCTLARVGVLWPLAAALKHLLPLPRLVRLFDAAPHRRSVAPLRAARLVDGLIRRAYRHRLGYCVERSLILFHLLRRGGHAAHIRFGVRKEDGGLIGHAWVVLDGTPVAEASDPGLHYTPTYSYPPLPKHDPS